MQSKELQKSPSKERINTLDSLRGLAALTVVLAHTTYGFMRAPIIKYTPLYLAITGHEAVVFFFILSGYVLIYRYRSNLTYNYGSFLMQRFFRIYVPYIVSFFIALALLRLSTPVLPNNDYISGMWHITVTFKDVIKHLIAIGNYNTSVVNPVIWSLVHEMRIAIIFPLLLFVVDLSLSRTLLLMAFTTIVSVILIGFNVTYTLGFNNSYGHTVYYFYMFTAGGLAAKFKEQLARQYVSLSTLQRSFLLIIVLLIYNYDNLLSNFFAPLHIPGLLKSTISDTVIDFFTVLASLYFIVAAVSLKGTNNFLTGKPAQFLGKISYSLYLIHLPVTAFIYFLLYGKTPIYVTLSVGFITSILLSVVFNKYVEQKSKLLFYKKNIA